MPNVRKRTGAMGGPLSTREPANSSDPVSGNVSKRGKYHSTNQVAPIDNSVAFSGVKNIGAQKAGNAVSEPGKFKY